VRAVGVVHALAESFVVSFKTELIADRVRRTRSQLELAVVEYIGWINTSRLHSALGYPARAEHEARERAEPVVPTPRARTAPLREENPKAATGLAAARF
jgi:transposase InsO family protein